jgi:hypothetical protein
MADPNPNRPEDNPVNRLQPDPALREGRAGRGWLWVVGLVLLAAIIVTFVALTGNENNVAQNPAPDASPPVTTGSGESSMPRQPPAPGRGNSAAPPTGQNTNTVR